MVTPVYIMVFLYLTHPLMAFFTVFADISTLLGDVSFQSTPKSAFLSISKLVQKMYSASITLGNSPCIFPIFKIF